MAKLYITRANGTSIAATPSGMTISDAGVVTTNAVNGLLAVDGSSTVTYSGSLIIAGSTGLQLNAETGVVKVAGLTVTGSTGTLTITNGKTLSVAKTLTLDGTDSTTMTFPGASATIARTDAGQTFTGTNVFGVMQGTSLALGGATIGTNELAVTGETLLTEAVGATALTITGATQTASFPCISATQTWNNSGVSFIGQNFDVTNTASTAASSYLIRMRVGGNVRFGIAAAHFANSGALRLNEGGGNPELITDASTAGFLICRQDGTSSLLDMTCRKTINGVQSLTGAGAVDVTNEVTKLTTNGVGNALTLADGINGQLKEIIYAVEGGGTDTAILTPTTKTGYTTITFAAIGNAVILRFLTTQGWMVVSAYGAVPA